MINSLDRSPGRSPREYSPYRFNRLSRFKMWQPESSRNRKPTNEHRLKWSCLSWRDTLHPHYHNCAVKYGVSSHGLWNDDCNTKSKCCSIEHNNIVTHWNNKSDIVEYQPCLCLCFGFSQMTMMFPFLLMILHFSQMGFTEDLTFIVITLLSSKKVRFKV